MLVGPCNFTMQLLYLADPLIRGVAEPASSTPAPVNVKRSILDNASRLERLGKFVGYYEETMLVVTIRYKYFALYSLVMTLHPYSFQSPPSFGRRRIDISCGCCFKRM